MSRRTVVSRLASVATLPAWSNSLSKNPDAVIIGAGNRTGSLFQPLENTLILMGSKGVACIILTIFPANSLPTGNSHTKPNSELHPVGAPVTIASNVSLYIVPVCDMAA
jgi:hypothetical protein